MFLSTQKMESQELTHSHTHTQVYDFAWPRRGTPDLEKIVDLCRSMDAWLRADRQNVIVVHCQVRLTTDISVHTHIHTHTHTYTHVPAQHTCIDTHTLTHTHTHRMA